MTDIVEYINLHYIPSGERDNVYSVFLSVLWLAGEGSRDVTEYISHHFETNNGCFVICLPIYIFI